MSVFCTPTLLTLLTTRTPACIMRVRVQIQTAPMTKVGRIWEDNTSVDSDSFWEDHDSESENSSDKDLPSDEEVEVVRGA